MKTISIALIILSLATLGRADQTSSIWPDIKTVAQKLALTENQPGYFSAEDDDIIIRCDSNKGEIYFASCPDLTRLGTDENYRNRWSHKFSEFFKEIFPKWHGADLAFTQMWIVMEKSEQKEMTLPFNDVVLHPDTYMTGCRTLTIRRK
jgi:hypothetical protein